MLTLCPASHKWILCENKSCNTTFQWVSLDHLPTVLPRLCLSSSDSVCTCSTGGTTPSPAPRCRRPDPSPPPGALRAKRDRRKRQSEGTGLLLFTCLDVVFIVTRRQQLVKAHPLGYVGKIGWHQTGNEVKEFDLNWMENRWEVSAPNRSGFPSRRLSSLCPCLAGNFGCIL